MPSTILLFQPANEIIPELNSLFRIFYKYWDVCSKRYQDYTPLQVEFICAELCHILANYWEKNGWLLAEIRHICLALDVCCEELNPNNFQNQKTAYIFHIQSCFRLKGV